MTEDEMVGWYHRLNDMSLGRLQVGVGQGGLACCSSWGLKTRTQLSNSTEQKHMINVQLTQKSRNVHTREKILGDHNSAYHWHIHRNFVF